MNYYNENDPHAALWLKELIAIGVIPPGEVDTRSIEDVTPIELGFYQQCHFFAGIGGWPLALQLAGVPSNLPLWTGSCPCQSFSSAGKRTGFDDPRHLWPAWSWLIRQCRPNLLFGEQVASTDGLVWWDAVATDLESFGYACSAFDLPAAGVGAPHIRQRLFWVAHSTEVGRKPEQDIEPTGIFFAHDEKKTRIQQSSPNGAGLLSADNWLGNAQGSGLKAPSQQRAECGGYAQEEGHIDPSAPSGWADLEWLPCADGKLRPTQPGLFPLADGIPSDLVLGCDSGLPQTENTQEARAMRLKGYGNAIVPQVAAVFIRSALEVIHA